MKRLRISNNLNSITNSSSVYLELPKGLHYELFDESQHHATAVRFQAATEVSRC